MIINHISYRPIKVVLLYVLSIAYAEFEFVVVVVVVV